MASLFSSPIQVNINISGDIISTTRSEMRSPEMTAASKRRAARVIYDSLTFPEGDSRDTEED